MFGTMTTARTPRFRTHEGVRVCFQRIPLENVASFMIYTASIINLVLTVSTSSKMRLCGVRILSRIPVGPRLFEGFGVSAGLTGLSFLTAFLLMYTISYRFVLTTLK